MTLSESRPSDAPTRPDAMRAVVRTRYGGPEVLSVVTRPVPSTPDDRVLVRVHASSVNPLDWHELRGEPFPVRTQSGLRRPRSERLGSDLAGVIVAVGDAVPASAGLAVGDRVLGAAAGAYAELVAARPDRLTLIPDGITFEAAAALPVAGCTALQALRTGGDVIAGQRVLIVGASGGVGTLAVQLAVAAGASVAAVTGPAGVDLVASLGARPVIDRTRSDPTRSTERFDVIIDLAGTHPVRDWSRALAPGGRLVVVGGPGGRWLRPMDRMIAARLLTLMGRGRFLPMLAAIRAEDLSELAAGLVSGALRPVIDRTFPLLEVVPAMHHGETGHPRGKVIISL